MTYRQLVISIMEQIENEDLDKEIGFKELMKMFNED